MSEYIISCDGFVFRLRSLPRSALDLGFLTLDSVRPGPSIPIPPPNAMHAAMLLSLFRILAFVALQCSLVPCPVRAQTRQVLADSRFGLRVGWRNPKQAVQEADSDVCASFPGVEMFAPEALVLSERALLISYYLSFGFGNL